MKIKALQAYCRNSCKYDMYCITKFGKSILIHNIEFLCGYIQTQYTKCLAKVITETHYKNICKEI